VDQVWQNTFLKIILVFLTIVVKQVFINSDLSGTNLYWIALMQTVPVKSAVSI
jgi:hypothetical protein